MSLYGSQRGINTVRRAGSRGDLNAASSYPYARGEGVVQRGSNGFGQEMVEGFGQTFSRGSVSAGQVSSMASVQQRVTFLQHQCQELLDNAAFILKTTGDSHSLAEADRCLAMAADMTEQLKGFAVEFSQQNLPAENLIRSVNDFSDQLRDLGGVLSSAVPVQPQKWSTRSMRRSVSREEAARFFSESGTLAREETSRFFLEAVAWITQQKRLIETAQWGDDLATVEQQLISHNAFHSSIQRSTEVERARSELMRLKDQNPEMNKPQLNRLEQEWDALQRSSHQRSTQLQELHAIIQQISSQIMWVNEREEEELLFDWGDRNIDIYIPQKQERFSKLMSELEQKEVDLNQLKGKVDVLLKNKHPASDKIQAYMETLQTQWSWLLQITKCIEVHLKENARYSQFFKETMEMNGKLQKEHDNIRKSFSCDKTTPLPRLLELQQGLESERERLAEQKETVQQLVLKAKSIIRLKPRNPEEKISGQNVRVQALCDFRQDERTMRRGDEGIVGDNSERSTWLVRGPGGLDMQVPSVCLTLLPPNPLAISLANKNSQYYEAILSVWNQLYINVKSSISWQYCLLDINRINSLTISMLSKMGPEEMSSLIRSLELHYQEFEKQSAGSELFAMEERRLMETQITGAQHHYQQLAGQLPAYAARGEGSEFTTAVSVRLLNQLHALRLKLDAADAPLMIFCHAPLGERAEEECQRHISTTQGLQRDVETLRTELTRIRDSVQLELKDAEESEKAKYLRSQLDITNQRLVNLENCCTSHLQRLGALRSLSNDVLRAEDVVKVYEARLTEKETMSLDPQEVLKQQGELKHMRGELQQKQGVLESVVSGLSGVQHLSEPQEQQRCVMGVAQYQEQVAQLGERWSRIQGQIRSRLDDLDSYLPQLDRFLRSSSALGEWIGATQQQLETLQATKPDDVKLLNQLLNQQKALNSEIKQKRELVEDVQKDGDVCIGAIKNYEQNLVSYSSGLETLLNIPVKRTVLQSPSSSISEQVSSLTAHYLQLLTRSADLHKLLMMSLKNTEELKIRNTQIKLLEDERLQLKDAVSEHSVTTSSLQEALLKYQQELSQSQTHLLALEEVKRSQTIKCMATRESLQSSQDQLAALSEEVRSLKLQLEDLERRKKVVEERYAFLQEEHDGAMRKKLKEQEQANWAKMELEKKVSEGGREVERLRKELDGEARRVKEARAELAKVRQEHAAEIREMTNTYESQILVTQSSMQRLSQQQESDSTSVRMEVDKLEEESRDLTEQLQMLRLSLAESDALRKSLEEEVKRLKRLGTEESRKRHELESQLQLSLSQKREAENQWKEVQEGSNRASQEKNGEIGQLTRCLEEERRNRRGVEAEVRRLRGELEEAAGKNQALSEELVRLRSSHHQLSLMRVELEAHALEKGRSDQSATRLQARAQELQEELKRLEAELEKQRNAAEEEAGKRRRAETQLEKSSQAMREYTTIITTLRKSQEEADGECRRLQEVLKEQKVSSQALAAARAELETLRGQLGQESERLLDANRRSEGLQRSLEEKSEGAAEAERLRRQGEAWAQERLRLEEELRLQRGDQRLADKMAAMQTQLESSQRADAEHERLIRQLSREREKLQAEIESVQTQARETSSVIQASQSQCVSLQQERDQLLARIQAMQQDAARVKSLDQEMSGLRLSLQTEQKLKAQLEEENHRIKKDFSQWKVQCQSHEEKIRQHGSEQAALESQFCSVRSEMERLRRQLTEAEEQYRLVLERQQVEMVSIRHTEVLETQQKPAEPTKVLLDSSSLLFEGVRKTVTAQQLHDCGVIDAATLELLVTGKKSVPDVAVDIKLNLKGTGAIAGLDAGPRGKMTFTEAKKLKLLPEESGRMLLEAQASTGHIIDPRNNVKMSLDEALVSGLVEEGDRKQLATAEAACVGFKDPKTTKVLSANQAIKKGLVERDTALRLLQAQEAAGGVLDPVLSVYLPKDTAMDRDLIDDDLYQALNAKPACYVDPESKAPVSYVTLKKQCKTDPSSGLLLLPAPEKPLTVRGLRREVSLSDLVDAKLLEPSDVDHVKQGTITSQDIEHRLRAYLRGSTCIAGVLDESKDSTLSIYQAMKNGLLRPGTTLELLEAQAASGFIIDPLRNQYFTVEEAVKNGLVGAEFKDKLLSAERAVTGYKDPGTGKKISLFEAMERGLIEKGHGIRLLEAQIASGGIIDPQHSHRIDTDVAYQRGYFDHAMNQILTDEGDDTKGFFDPNTEDNLTYLQLKSRCICDPKSGLVLLPLHDKKKASKRKRRVLIVDPDTNKEMSVREAYESKLIDYQTFLELSQQECEWEERSVTAPDGTTSTAIVDVKNGIHYDLKDLLSKGLIGQDVVDKYRSGSVSLTQLADMITNKMKSQGEPLSSTSLSFTSQTTLTSQTTSQTLTTQTKTVTKAESVSTQLDSSSTGGTRHISSMSVKLGPLVETLEEQNPVGAIFDTEKLEKISVSDALKRGVLDSITAQRLLEAQACTGGLVNPENGRRVSIQEATRLGVIDDEMANRLKPAQKAYIGFEEVKTRRMMSAAEAVKEKWLPYEAGQRFLEFQYLTGGLFDPESGSRRSLEEALQLGWLDMRAAQRLQDTRHHPKSLTCPKTKLRISYKEALDACMNEENTGVRMLPAAMVSSRGISSPYNLSNPNSAPGSRSGSRRGSVDHGLSPSSSSRYSSFSYSRTSFSSRSLT